MKVPPKTKFFIQKSRQEIIPTKCFLSSRIPTFQGGVICSWWHQHPESLDHLFFKCELASWAWNFMSKWWKANLVSFTRSNLWSGMYNIYQGTAYCQAWNMSMVAVLWSIWLTRSELIFKNVKALRKPLEQVILICSFQWGLANK